MLVFLLTCIKAAFSCILEIEVDCLMNKELKAIEDQLIEMLNKPPREYRKNALKVIDEFKDVIGHGELSTNILKDLIMIVDNYPDFDNIHTKIYQPNLFQIDVYIKVDSLKDNKKNIRKTAKYIYSLYRKFNKNLLKQKK